MDLSGLIFVALFVGWAIYLIPKFMRDHEELATTRTLQDFSARVRVFAATRTLPKMDLYGPDEPTIEIAMAEVEAVLGPRPVKAVRALPTRAAAKKAAKRRRRVLLTLVLMTTVVGVVAGLRYAPLWSPAIPAMFVLLFMMSARRAVRRASAVRRAPARRVPARRTPAQASPRVAADRLETVETSVARVEESVARVEESLEAESATPAIANQLWDPVPMTLPTYLDKPAARRTVMSIELNQGIVSSGHDAADSELVRAAEAAAALDDTPVDLEAPRRAAGA